MASANSPPGRSVATISSIRELVRTSRPLGWFAAFALFRIGIASAQHGVHDETLVTIGLSVALTFPFCLYLFGLNDLADKESDIDNPRKGNWIHGAGTTIMHPTVSRWAPWVGCAMVAVFIPVLPIAAGTILASILVVSWAYSAPPLRLKEIPIIDGCVTASIMIGLVCVGFLSGSTPSSIPLETFAVAPTLAGLHIFASVVDVQSDQKAHHRTLAVRAGPRAASVVALALSIVSAASIAWLDYAPPIAVYLLLQPCVIATWMLLHRRFTPRHAISVLGLAGLLTLAYMALVYVRNR